MHSAFRDCANVCVCSRAPISQCIMILNLNIQKRPSDGGEDGGWLLLRMLDGQICWSVDTHSRWLSHSHGWLLLHQHHRSSGIQFRMQWRCFVCGSSWLAWLECFLFFIFFRRISNGRFRNGCGLSSEGIMVYVTA